MGGTGEERDKAHRHQILGIRHTKALTDWSQTDSKDSEMSDKSLLFNVFFPSK